MKQKIYNSKTHCQRRRFRSLLFVLTGLFILFAPSLKAQTWQDVGTAGFSAGQAPYQSLAFHPTTNEPYVAYRDDASGNGGRTTVMRFNGTAWVNVGTAGFSAGQAVFQSLAFHPTTNEPYVAYRDDASGNGGRTTVMRFNGTAWVNVGTAAFSSAEAQYQSLGFHPTTNEPYVAYRDFANGRRTTVMRFNGTAWVNVGTAAFSAGLASYQSLGFHPTTNEPYVAYRDEANSNRTTVMRFNGMAWVNVGTAAFSAGSAFYQSLAFHPTTNEPYVAYYDQGNGNRTTVMRFNGTAWVNVGTAAFSAGSAFYQSLAFHPTTNEPYVAYHDQGNSNRTTVMRFNGTAWVNVGTAGFSAGGAFFQSLAFHPTTNEPYVAYRDGGNGAGTTVMRFGAIVTSPTVTTAAQSNVTATTADLGGDVTADGGAPVTDRGIVWSTSTAPTTLNNKVQIGTGTGVFNQTITGLPSNTTVFVRAYAINSEGTSYGNEINFTTSAPPTNALDFDGTNDFVAASNFISINTEFTYEFWMKTTAISGAFFTTTNGANSVYSSIIVNNGKIVFSNTAPAGSSGGRAIFSDNDTYNDGNWHHIAAVKTATQIILYVDGVEVGSTLGGNSINDNISYHLGYSRIGSPNYLDGQMDEVRIWNTARTCSEINANKNNELVGNETGLIVYYNFNQGVAAGTNTGLTTLDDLTANNNDGTLTNFALTGSASNWVASTNGVSGTTPSAVTDINLQGGSPLVSITDGDTTPDAADDTNFGSVANGTPSTVTYTIQNTVAATTLTVADIVVSGTNAGDFVVSNFTNNTTVAGNATTTFDVTFTPSATGIRNATITINNSDCDEAAYDFAVRGTGVAPTNALDFDGSNDFVEINNSITIGADYTYEFWFRTTAAGGALFAGRSPANSGATYNNIELIGGRIAFTERVPASNTGGRSAQTTTTFNDGNWHHLAAVHNTSESTIYLYIDGNLTGTDGVGSGINGDVDYFLGVNTPGSPRYLDGELDEVRIWNTARTCSEINANKNNELVGNETGLIVYYNFNQGVAAGTNTGLTTLDDLTANNNDGTLTNFALTGSASNWVASTNGVSGTTPSVLADINLQGGSPLVSITDGDTTPDAADDTDFGSIANGTPSTVTYTIQNTVAATTLTVADIVVSGTNAGDFVVSNFTNNTTVAGNATTTFDVTFTPSATGIRNATITINNSDCDEAAYDFAVRGTGVAPTNALDFDGTNDWVNTSIVMPSTYTKEVWVFIPSANGRANNIISGGIADGQHAFWISSANSYRLASGHNGAWQSVIDASPIPFGSWQHVVVTYDATTQEMKLYRNGNLVDDATGVPNFSSGTKVRLGAFGDNVNLLGGQMDEVRIWNTVRTCSEINANKNNELVGNETGLIAYYNFNQGVAAGTNTGLTTLDDLTTNNNDGTLTNFALTGSASNWVASTNGVSGTTPSAVTDINLQGGSPLVSITDGDTTPDAADDTDFGNVFTNRVVTYTIQNTVAGSTLNIADIVVSGANSSDFVVSNFTNNTTVAGNATTTFDVTFTPSALAVRNATITINNSDCDESAYDFAVRGTGVAPTNALDFDGSDYVSASVSPLYDGLSSLSVEVWVYATSTDQQIILHRWQGTNQFSLEISGGQRKMIFVVAGSGVVSSANTFPINEWVHVACVFDGAASTMSIYENGQLTGSIATPRTSINASSSPLTIGRRSDSPTQFLTGKVDEVRIWNTVRTQTEIANNRNTELVGNETGLVAYYTFDEGTAGANNTAITAPEIINHAGGCPATMNGFAKTGTTSNWVTGNSAIVEVTQGVVIQPEINLLGNGNSITDGDTTPDAADDTDFGSVTNGTPSTVTYTIQNTVAATTLTVADIVVSGTNAADFVVSNFTNNTTVAGNATTTFDVTFTPSATGIRNATITINNSDCDEAAYDFAVRGTGISSTPEINLVGNGIDILTGTTATSTTNNTDFGQTVGTSVSKTFAIQNTGTGALNVANITSSNPAFSFENVPTSFIVNDQRMFQIVFTPTVSGVQTSTITITNNDADEAAYTFTVAGEGICPVTTDVFASTSTVLPNQVGSIRVNSKLGVIYQLQNVTAGNTDVGNPIAGTGGVIYLPTNQLTTTTSFRVIANRGLNCGNVTSNTVTITVSGSVTGYGYQQTELNTCSSTSTIADITVTLLGSSFLWDDTNTTTTQNLSNVENGIYSVNIDNGTTLLPVIVGSPVLWEKPIRATLTNEGRIVANGVYDWNLNEAAATSKSKLESNENGGFTFIVEDMTTIEHVSIGFSTPNEVSSYLSIDNSFYVESNGNLSIYLNDVNFYLDVEGITVSVGDRLTITREGTSINYYYNAELVYSDVEARNATDELVVDIALVEGTSPQVWFSKCGSNFFEVNYVQNQEDACNTPSTGEGSVTLLPQVGGVAPYTYAWTNGATAIANPTGLTTGLTSVEVTDNEGYKKVLPVIIGNPVNWTDLQNVSASQGKLFTSGFVSTYSNSGAISQTGMGASTDGGITYIYSSAVSNYVVGLSAQNTNPDWATILYGVYIYNGTMLVYQSGVVMARIEEIADQDRISMIRKGNQIIFYQNSTEVHRMASTTADLFVDVTLESGQTPVIFASWCTTTASDLVLTYSQTAVDDCTTLGTNEGAITLQGNGGLSAYTYNWTDGSTDNPRVNLARGIYEVTLGNGVSTVTAPIIIGGFANWGNLTTNTTQIAGTITSSVSTDFTTPEGGLSTNRLAASTDGGISFIVPNTTDLSNFQIGLSSTTAIGSDWESMGYSVWINGENSILIYESGVYVGATQSVIAGDRISIIRKAGNVEYYINSKRVRITTVGGITQELAADISIIAGTSPTVYASFCNTGFRIANKTKAPENVTQTNAEVTLEKENRFAIYPNPSTGIFNVRFATQLTANTEVTIFDGIGRAIKTQTFEKGNQKFSIDLNNQPKGVYLIRFNQNGATYSKSIVIE